MSQGAQKAPTFAKVRDAVAAVDVPATVAALAEKVGVNFNGHEYAHFSIRPSGGANPDVQVWAYDGVGFAALQEAEAVQTGIGADLAYQFSVRAAGRVLFVAVTTIAAGALDVYASGWDAHGGAG